MKTNPKFTKDSKVEESKDKTQMSKPDRAGVKSNKKDFKKRCRENKSKVEFPKQNDPAFYTKYKELSENAARIAFSHRNGSDIHASVGTYAINGNIDPILSIAYVPIPGATDTLLSGINVSANAAYKVLNRKYRGSPASRYQMADLGISQFAILDFYLSLAQAERIYGLCQVARVNQRQVPRELVFALGADYERIANNLANFRAHLNAIIVRAQVLCLVKGYPLLEHHMFLLSNVFKDKDTARANFFAYRKPGYWLWDPTTYTTGSALRWVPNTITRHMYRSGGAPATYYGLMDDEDIITNLNAQLDALLNDSDIDAICADILALFENNGDNDLIKLQFLPDGYSVDPIFTEEALYQLHNSVFQSKMGASGSATAPDDWNNVNKYFGTIYPTSLIPSGGTPTTGLLIYQESGIIKFNVVCAGSSSALTQVTVGSDYNYGVTSNNQDCVVEPIIDTDKLNPSPDEVIEMTRQMSTWYHTTFSSGGSTYHQHICDTIGTVLLANATFFRFNHVGKYAVDSSGNYNYGTNLEVTMVNSVDNGTNLAKASKFDWFPIFYTGGGDLFGDLDNYRSINTAVLKPIHEAATLSEFHNPIADILIKDL